MERSKTQFRENDLELTDREKIKHWIEEIKNPERIAINKGQNLQNLENTKTKRGTWGWNKCSWK